MNAAVPESAMLLMDAVKVALSSEENATLTTSYQKVSAHNLDASIVEEDILAKAESIEAAENSEEKVADKDQSQDIANKTNDDVATQADAESSNSESADKPHNSIMDEEIIESVEE